MRYVYYGDCDMLLGPSSSRLFEANSVFVKQVHVTDTDRKGVVLYGFSQKPELSLEESWSVSNYMIVGSYSHKVTTLQNLNFHPYLWKEILSCGIFCQGFSLWLNKGSRIQLGLEAEKTSLNQLDVSVSKGRHTAVCSDSESNSNPPSLLNLIYLN